MSRIPYCTLRFWIGLPIATPESCPRAAVVAFTGQLGTAEKSDPGRAFPSRPENRTKCRKIAASNQFCAGIRTPRSAGGI